MSSTERYQHLGLEDDASCKVSQREVGAIPMEWSRRAVGVLKRRERGN